MIVKLDAYDKKIISILLSDSRESITAIARKARLARENADYRMKRLVNLGIVKQFITYFDEDALNIKKYTFFAQLIGMNENKEKEIVIFLKNHQFITWIGSAAGKWSMVFDIHINQKTGLKDVVNEFLEKFGRNLDEYVILEIDSGKHFFSKYLGFNEKNETKRKITKKIDLDDIDYKILSLLNLDSRITYAILSKKVGLTANAIKKRIGYLEKSGIIQKYSINLDFKKFGFEWYGIQLKLTKFNQELTKAIHAFFENHPQVIFYYKNIGQWDYDIGVIVKNSNELRVFINELRLKFPEELKIIDVFITLDEIKGYTLPEGVFKRE